jgi:hypothetical protein
LKGEHETHLLYFDKVRAALEAVRTRDERGRSTDLGGETCSGLT